MSDTTSSNSEQPKTKLTQDTSAPVKAKKAAKKTAKKAAKKVAKKVATTATPASPTADKPVVRKTEQTPAPAKLPEQKQQQAPQQNQPPQNEPSDQQSNQQNNDQNSEQKNNNPRRGRVAGKGKVHQNQNQNKNQNKNQRGRNNNNNQNQNQNQNSNNSNNNQNNNRNKNNRNKRGKNNRNNQNNNQNNNQDRIQDRTEKKVELTGPAVAVNGMLELAPKGFGFLRTLDKGLEQANDDVFVTPDLIRTHGLRLGVWIHGEAMQGPRGLQLTTLTTINGKTPDEARKLPHFEELKAVNPNKRISLETTPERFTTRVLDIIAPVGRGQRGLIVSPPRSGKTTLMMHMAEAVQEKYDDTMHLMILLVDERPEEVTEFRHSLPDAEIYASSNDSGPKNHCRVAELCVERAKRLVESGEHVFILMDSITRLARAYNAALGGDKSRGNNRGIQSGGIITGALEMPRRLFAAARNTRTAGSLTIVATALVGTNSRADDAIFQEFKGTGNMELVLDRKIAERYIYPAVDIFKSGTRREELILPEISLHKIHLIRRGLAGHRPEEAMERLAFFLKRFNNNAQMLLEIKG